MITPLFFFIFILKFSMKQDVKLYISDRLVDFSSELSMPFTYQLKDLNNPSIVKNPFTKTIDIIGTPNNNKIFGEIYNFDREQMYDANKLVGAYFNPSVRTPFKIYRNGEIIENGYMQLNTITIKKGDIHYNITLYGGIGNFFYSLMYNEDNEPLTLADLVYGVEDEQTGLPFENPDDEMNFNINKQFVYECFNNVGKDNNNTITDYITFVPSYNGLPENFDSDKVLINTFKNSYWSGTTSKTDGNKTYSTYNNYVLAQLPRKYTEWEILDLRSYLQRPAIKMSKIIDACSNPINNGGYTVELDPDFFNVDNPYYNDAWVALPLLSNQEKEKNNITSVDGRLVYQNLKVGDEDLGGGNILTAKKNTDYLVPKSQFTVTNNTSIDMTNLPVGTLLNVELDLNLNFITDNLENDNLYLSSLIYEDNGKGLSTYYLHQTAVVLQIVVYDGNNTILSSSDLLLFSTFENNSSSFISTSPIDKQNYKSILKDWTPLTDVPFNVVNGKFVKVDDKYVFERNSNNNFHLELNNIPYSNQIKLGLIIERVLDNPPYEISTIFNYGKISGAYKHSSRSAFNNSTVSGYFEPTINTITISRDEPDNIITTGSLIKKSMLLKTEKSPADYLLSYTKLFNLFYTVDESNKTVKIQTMNNYFNGNVIDWSNKIDYSKDITIKPLMFDKKFYCMKQEGESYYLNKYKNEYTVEYGQKRINSNYNFNAETQQLFENNVYQNAISAIDTSPYYHTFYDYNGNLLAPYSNENYTYKLFYKHSTNDIDTIDVDYKTTALAGGWSWNRNSGYDNFAKTCFYNLQNDEKSLTDVSSVLLFYNGQVEPTDYNGNSIKYKLTDDISAMYTLNDKTPCWLFSDTTIDSYQNIITYNCPTLPQFLRYKIVGNQVQASWDFGKPKEMFIPNTTYNDSTTLYEQYWHNYYTDQLDINTKEITCYVNLNNEIVNGELLKNFYYFNGCYWILNKIENYNINNYETTKCTFIRVNNLSNYTNNEGGL